MEEVASKLKGGDLVGRVDEKGFPFEGWTAREINYVIGLINNNVPADESGMKLDDRQKELYKKMRKDLAKENKDCGFDPWVIGYDLMELETE